MKSFQKGLKDGIPIGLGYLSVSFTFGIIAITYGLYWWEAVIISMLTLTSAGQFSGISTMLMPGQYLTMLISQMTINVRYSFMSISLGQKVDKAFSGIWRWLFGFFITDEIFAVAVSNPSVSRSYMLGLSTIPYLGWSLGTLSGALLGNILPDNVMSALALAIYGMFVAIVVPEMKKARPVIYVVILACVLSCLFTFCPGLKEIPSGLTISICAIISALIGAFLFPLNSNDNKGEAA